MINEIKKPNDIFVSVLTDPSASITNLMASGLNVDNTGLLSPEQYKQSDFVKKQFTDQNGKFQDDKFNQAYMNDSWKTIQEQMVRKSTEHQSE